MRNILEKARKCDYDEVKTGAQAIYLAESRTQAEASFRRFRARWQRTYPAVVQRLGRDLPELLSFFAFPPARKQLAHLLHCDFILEVVRIEWIHSSLRRFGLRIHEIHQRLFGRPWQLDIVSVVICHPIHLP